MIKLRTRRRRSAATLVESAITLLVFLILVLGMIDLGTGVLRYNAISQAARHGTRQAIIHGDLCPADYWGGNWGSSTITVQASDTSGPGTPAGAVAALVSPMLGNCDLNNTTITVQWPNGSNRLEQPVQVTISTTWQPVTTYLFGATVTLQASSTMPMAHSRAAGQ
jgi:Flp pilus assembly protein TadG